MRTIGAGFTPPVPYCLWLSRHFARAKRLRPPDVCQHCCYCCWCCNYCFYYCCCYYCCCCCYCCYYCCCYYCCCYCCYCWWYCYCYCCYCCCYCREYTLTHMQERRQSQRAQTAPPAYDTHTHTPAPKSRGISNSEQKQPHADRCSRCVESAARRAILSKLIAKRFISDVLR